MGLGPGTGPLQLVCFVDSRVGCWVLPADPPAPACSGQVGAMIEGRLLPAPQALLKGAEGGPSENFSPRWTPGVPGCTVPAALVDVHGALTPDRHRDTGNPAPEPPAPLGPRGPVGAQHGLLGSEVYLPLLPLPAGGRRRPGLKAFSPLGVLTGRGVAPTGSQPPSASPHARPINIPLRL